MGRFNRWFTTCRYLSEMAKLASFLGAVMVVLCAPPALALQQQCRLCEVTGPDARQPQQQQVPLSIEIITKLDFSKIALSGSGQGEVRLDPDGGQRSLSGNLVDLGGYSMAGTAIVKGEPGRTVRIDMPDEVRMISSGGGVLWIAAMRTNLPPAPRLDTNGELRFAFAGNLEINGSVSGTFRGRIPITATYE